MSEPRSLPPRPDLRRLRDEARSRRRSGEFPTLAKAQFAVAREHGFTSWPRLKIHVEALSLAAAERAAALVRSACSSDLRHARTLLELDPALARYDLACACVTGEAGEVARQLERAPGRVRDAVPPLGREPLLYACFSRFLRAEPARARGIRAAVRLLLDAGADPNASFDHAGWRQVPLYGAAGIANDPELTRMLIAAGADPNDASEPGGVGEALYHAVEFPDVTCAALLVDAGTLPHVVDRCLGRALNFADPAAAEMLCARGARASAGQLHQAVFRRRPPRTVGALLDAGASLEAPDAQGRSALALASRWGERETVELLLARGADPTTASAEDRALGAFLTGRSSAPPHPDGLADMLDMAVQAGDLAATRLLLDAGADPDGDPTSEFVPLGQAAWRGHSAVVAELLRRGATTRFRDGGSAVGAALHGSQHCNDPEGGPTMQLLDEIPKERYVAVVRILLEAGAYLPEQLADGQPTLALLAELGVEPPP